MENEQNQLKKERPFYQCVKSSTAKGFIQQLNKAQKKGYKPIWDTREDSVDNNYQPPIVNRNVIVYDSESLELDNTETDKRKTISNDILEAEFHATKASNDLKDIEDYLTLHTDWNLAGAETGNKISNKEQREAFIRGKTVEEREWMETTKQWLSHVKRLSLLHERAEGNPPWITPEETEEEAELKSEKVYVERIGEPEGET